MDRDFADTDTLPIGFACANTRIVLIDGEICVAGSCLSPGYYNAPDKTAAAFVQNPMRPQLPEIIYKTGDLGAYNKRGELMFLGRRDNQIKRSGYRIELGEIEVALHSLAGMQAAACLYDAARDRILCVYAGGMEPDALAKDLRKLLPKYMLPNLYEKLEALPYNANGKIDRVALKERYLHAEG